MKKSIRQVSQHSRLIVLALLVSFRVPSNASPAGIVSVTGLVPRADTIIVAMIVQGNAVNGVATATLKVEQVLKGSLPVGATVIVSWTGPVTIQPTSQSLALDRGLFFLRNDAGGKWEVLPGMTGQVDFRRTYFLLPGGQQPAVYTPSPTAPVLDKVLLALAWAEEVGHPPDRGAIVNLVYDFRNSRSQALRDVFVRFAQSTSPKLRVMGIQALVGGGDLKTLATVEAEQSALLAAPAGSEIFNEIKLYFRNTDPVSIKQLGRLATSSSSIPQLKDACAAALARLHTKEALPYLAELLDSPVLWTRTYAVGGLAMFANNVPIGSHHPAPGDWPYRTEETMAHSVMDPGRIGANESYYIGFWKDWWSKHRLELAGQ